MRNTTRLLSAAAVASIAIAGLTGCMVVPGPATTEEHEVGADVHAVELRVPGDLEIALGDTPGLTITAGENVIDRLTVDERGDVLVLDRTPGPWWGMSGGIRYELTVTSLDAVTIDGAGDIVADFGEADDVTIEIDGSGEVEAFGIDAGDVSVLIDGSGEVELGDVVAERVEIAISGSGDVHADGTADSLVVSIDGAGEVDTAGLVVADAEARISGSGDISVHAEDTLTARIDGSGEIRYRGDPEVDSRISGSGEVVED